MFRQQRARPPPSSHPHDRPGSSDNTVSAVLAVPSRIWNVTVAVAGQRLNTHASFRPTRFVWSRGLALSCDHNGGFAFVRRQRGGGRPALRFDADAYAGIRDGDLVWVRLTALPQFVDEVLPHIETRVRARHRRRGLVDPIRLRACSRHHRESECALLVHPELRRQRRDRKDISDSDWSRFSHDQQSAQVGSLAGDAAASRKCELDELRTKMPANAARLVRAHADFHFNKRDNAFYGETRHTIQEILSANPSVDFQPRKLSRCELWREKTRYAFVDQPARPWARLPSHLGVSRPRQHRHRQALLARCALRRAARRHRRKTGAISLSRSCAAGMSSIAMHSREEPVQERLTNRYWITRIRRILDERMHDTKRDAE